MKRVRRVATLASLVLSASLPNCNSQNSRISSDESFSNENSGYNEPSGEDSYVDDFLDGATVNNSVNDNDSETLYEQLQLEPLNLGGMIDVTRPVRKEAKQILEAREDLRRHYTDMFFPSSETFPADIFMSLNSSHKSSQNIEGNYRMIEGVQILPFEFKLSQGSLTWSDQKDGRVQIHTEYDQIVERGNSQDYYSQISSDDLTEENDFVLFTYMDSQTDYCLDLRVFSFRGNIFNSSELRRNDGRILVGYTSVPRIEDSCNPQPTAGIFVLEPAD